MSDSLKSCPFCGGTAEFRSVGIGHYVACTRCDSSSVMLKAVKEQVEDDLIEAWNSRPSAPLAIKRYKIFHDEANSPTLVESADGPVCLIDDVLNGGYVDPTITPTLVLGGLEAPVGTSEFARSMKDYEAFVADVAPDLHWKVWYASGSYEGGFDGYRHGFGMFQLGPAPLPELMEQMRQALREVLAATAKEGQP